MATTLFRESKIDYHKRRIAELRAEMAHKLAARRDGWPYPAYIAQEIADHLFVIRSLAKA